MLRSLGLLGVLTGIVTILVTATNQAQAQSTSDCDRVLIQNLDYSTLDSATAAAALSYMDKDAWSQQQSGGSAGGGYLGIGANASYNEMHNQATHEVQLFSTSTSDTEKRSLISEHMSDTQVSAWVACVTHLQGLHVVRVPNQGGIGDAVIEITYSSPDVSSINATVSTLGGTLIDANHLAIQNITLSGSTAKRFFLVRNAAAEDATVIVSTTNQADSVELLWTDPKVLPSVVCHLYRLPSEPTEDFDVTLLPESACRSDAENTVGPGGVVPFNWSFKLMCYSPTRQLMWAGGQNQDPAEPVCRKPM